MVDITDSDDLWAWLEVRDRADAIAIAARAALRVLPLVDTGLGKNLISRREAVILSLFRATSISWTVVLGRDRGITAADIVAARYAARAADSRTSAAAAAATAAASAASDAANAYAYAASAASASVRAVVARAAADIWTSVSADATALEQGLAPAALATRKLWPGDLPDWVIAHWTRLKSHLLAAGDEDWRVWTDWYEARVRGDAYVNEDLETAKALIPDEIWRQGPAAANAEIRRLIDHHAPSRETLADAESAQPFINDAGQLDVQPNEFFDKPEGDDEFLTLPAVQRSVIRTLLVAVGEQGNIPEFVSEALREYDSELLKRGLRPILGILKSQHRIVSDEFRIRESDGQITHDGLRAAFQEFAANHRKILDNFPLDARREALYIAAHVDRTQLDPGEMRSLAAAFMRAVDAVEERGFASADFVTVSHSIAEDLQAASYAALPAPETAMDANRALIEMPELSFADRAVIRAMGFSFKVTERAKSPTAPKPLKEAVQDTGLILTATEFVARLVRAFPGGG